MMPDDDKVVEDSKIPLATKLALLLGLMPQNNLGGTLSDVGPGHFLMSSEFSDDKEKVWRSGGYPLYFVAIAKTVSWN